MSWKRKCEDGASKRADVSKKIKSWRYGEEKWKMGAHESSNMRARRPGIIRRPSENENAEDT
jgi:hypothetical protein